MNLQRLALFLFFCLTMVGLYNLYCIGSFSNKDLQPLVLTPYPKHLKYDKPDLYIYMTGSGRLGNLLTQYAATEGLGSYYNRTTYYSNIFRILNQLYYKIDIKFGAFPRKNYDIVFESRKQKVVKLPPNKITILKGFFQNFLYFKNITNLLMTTFSNFKQHISFKVQQFITDVKKIYYSKNELPPMTQAESVCIHVRRGDFLSAPSKQTGRTVADRESITFAMDYFRIKKNHFFFIFISKEMSWCKTNFQNKDIFYSQFSSPFDDFVLASSCDHSIMTVGTFGWWSSWLIGQRGGKVMYYKRNFRPGTFKSTKAFRNVWFPGNWLAYTNSSVELSKDIS